MPTTASMAEVNLAASKIESRGCFQFKFQCSRWSQNGPRPLPEVEAEKSSEGVRRNSRAHEAADRGSCFVRNCWLLRQSSSAKHQTEKLAENWPTAAPYFITKGKVNLSKIQYRRFEFRSQYDKQISVFHNYSIWNKGLWLAKTSHVTCIIQSECFISPQRRRSTEVHEKSSSHYLSRPD